MSLDEILEDDTSEGGTFEELSGGGIEEVTFSLDAKRAAEHIHELPDLYKEVLILRFVDGLGPKEISELIEETENVVSVRIYRGLKMLRETIAEEEQKAEDKRTGTNKNEII
jgi:RNA polymerase sigma-70 factor (ECF subfamily)